MDRWFTVEEIDRDTFAISEYGHWEETHCYLLRGERRTALIDTGLGVSDIREIVDGLTGLPVVVLTTHAHWDHIGGHGRFGQIAVHEAEKVWLSGRFPIPLQMVKNALMRDPCAFPPDFRIEDYRVFQGGPQMLLHDGDRIDLGGRTLQVLHTPGHSPGHCCFYEADRRYLYSGDLIYRGCLDAFYPSADPEVFWHSVQRLQAFEVSRILPGHHQLSVAATIIGEIERAFRGLSKAGKLKQGSGVFSYGQFQLHI